MTAPEPALTAGRDSYVRWRIVGLLAVASFVSYLLRTNMSVAGERMMSDLGLTQVQLGVVLAGFAWGYGLFQLPGGLLGEWLGGRKALALIAVAWGALNMAVGAVPTAGGASVVAIIGTLTALRFAMGAAQAPLYPIASGQTIARWFPVTGWALPNGVLNAGLTLGSAATGPLIAWLATTVGWRLSFVLTGPLGLAIAGIWWWYARDRPEEHAAVRARELLLIKRGRAEGEQQVASRDWGVVLRDRNVLLVTVSYFCSNYVFYFFFNWLYIYLVDVRKFEALKGGAFAAAPWVAGAVGAVLGGVACDRISKRYGFRWGPRVVSIVGLTLAGVFIIAAGAAASPHVAVVFLCLCLAAQQFTDSAAWAAAMMVGGRHASAACGVLNTGGNVVGGIGALLVPISARALGWPAALGIASVFALLGALVWLWIEADRPARAQPAPPVGRKGGLADRELDAL